MLELPVEVICNWILPHLSVCDLQALDTAYTNKCLRPQLRQVWISYQYDKLDVKLLERQISWLVKVGVQICSVAMFGGLRKSVISKITTLKRLHVQSEVHSDLLLKVAANNPNLIEVHVSIIHKPNVDNAVAALARNCRQLHTLHIGNKELTDTGIKALARRCHQLHTLHLDDSSVSDAGIQALCDNCPHLKHIELIGCHNLTDTSLTVISNTYQRLQSIHIKSDKFTDDGLISIAEKCHELRSVGVTIYGSKSRGLTALWAVNPKLMDVKISFISDDDIIQLVQCCPLLHTLNLYLCGQITDAAVIAVAEHCPQLKSLNVNRCYDLSDASLIALGQHCHELRSISISNFFAVSDVGMAALAAGCPLLQEFDADNTKITDAGVVALARGCRDLRIVHLTDNKLIGFAAMSAIALNCPLISELHINSCRLIDDSCMHAIAQHCRNLTFIHIRFLPKIHLASILCVLSSCRMLDVMYCIGIIEFREDIESMKRSSRRLSVLKVCLF